MPLDRFGDRGRAAIVQQRAAQPKAPQSRGANLLPLCRGLDDPITGPDVVQQQIGEEGHGPPIEQRVGGRAGRQCRHVTGGTTDCREEAFTVTCVLVRMAARDRREEPHERLEVIDAAPSRRALTHVLGLGQRIAAPHLILRDGEDRFAREHVVRDPHFIPIRIRAERQQRRVLRLPAEAPDPALTGGGIGDHGGTSADTIPIPILRILQGQNRIVRDRFNEPGSKQRNRRPPRNHRHIVWNLRLASMRRNRKQVNQSIAVVVQSSERAIGVAISRPRFEDDAGAADRRHVVTDRAAGSVEGRPEPLFSGFDFGEVVEAEAKLGEFPRRESRQWIAGLTGRRLTAEHGVTRHARDPHE